jgi:leucyl aminopeptidase
MEHLSDNGLPQQLAGACVVVGVFQSRRLSAAAEAVDQAAGGVLTHVCERGDMDGRAGQTLLLHDLPNVAAERVLLVGCGREKRFDDGAYLKAVAAAASVLNGGGSTDAQLCLAQLPVKGRELGWRLSQGVAEAERTLYRFDQMRSKKKEPKHPLTRITWVTSVDAPTEAADTAIRQGEAIAHGVALARDLGNLPGNICTPSYLAEQAHAMGGDFADLKVQVLEQGEMEEMGMGALLSVSRGSRQPPRFIIMEYRGDADGDARPVVLVGKGVTFDAGGISIKPSAAMDEMKFDMCGAASVFGAFRAVLELGLPINLIGLVPACENLPDGDANKPGDVVTSLSGQTIEVLNTDAEGRLLLCDALTYSERFDPELVVDVATLTGACVIALGRHASGLYSNHSSLARQIEKAGRASGDRVWEMPLWDEYQEQLKSPFADMANIGGREAGSVTAACFLSRFTKKLRWAHLDIAGTAWISGGDKKGATGRPVALLTRFLLDRCGD